MNETIANYTYSPSYLVRQVNNIWHLDNKLHPVNHDFNITYNNYDDYTTYEQSLMTVPVICGVLGIVAVFVLQTVLCMRTCFSMCRCLPKMQEQNGEVSAAEVERALGTRFKVCLTVFIIAGVLAVAANQLNIVGSLAMTNGVETGQGALDYLYDMFTNLNNYGNTFLVDGNQIYYNLGNASITGCSQAAILQAQMGPYFDYVEDYIDIVEPVPGECSDAKDGLQTWGIDYKDNSIWALYGILMLGLGIYVVGLVFKHRMTLQVGIGVSEVIVVILFILIAVEMAIVMGVGDFCMDPIINTQRLVPRDVYNVTVYYTSCVGENPLQPSLDAVTEFTNDFSTALNALSALCPTNTYVQACYPLLDDVENTLTLTTNEIACPPTQSQLNDILEDGLCDDVFHGIYYVWMGQYLTTSLVLVCTIAISLCYQYFGTYWGTVEVNAPPPTVLFDNTADRSADNANEFYYGTSTSSVMIEAAERGSNVIQ